MSEPRKLASLTRLLGRLSTPVYVVDERRIVVYANQACADWLRAPLESIVGRRCDYQSEDASSIHLLCPAPAAWTGRHVAAPVIRPGCDNNEPATAEVAECLLLSPTDGERGLMIVAIRGAGESAAQWATRDRSNVDLHFWLRKLRRSRELPLALLAGVSAAIEQARAQVALAAQTAVNVAIVGPRGAGKRRLAQAIHARRAASDGGPLVFVDCETASPELLDAALHSLVTGGLASQTPERNQPPTESSAGKQVNASALLLENFDRVSPELALALNDKIETLLGLSVLTTSRVSLTDLEARGRAPRNLICRLATLEIRLLPLAARREDLPLVIQAIVESFNAQGGSQRGGVSRELMARLITSDYPGDFAQLELMLGEAHGRANGPEITLDDLPSTPSSTESRRGGGNISEPFQLDTFLRQVEQEIIQRALKRSRGNKTKAAKLLGLSRPRLYRRMVQLGLIEAPEGWPLSVDEDPTDEAQAPPQ